MTVMAAQLDNELFQTGYELLADSPLELTAFENTFVEGIINCSRPGLLYTSIPQNGNWTVKVDGQPAEISLVGECMIGVMLPEGNHTVSFTYRNAAFSLGWKVSLLCMTAFLVLVQTVYKPDWQKLPGKKRRHGKYQR